MLLIPLQIKKLEARTEKLIILAAIIEEEILPIMVCKMIGRPPLRRTWALIFRTTR